MQSLPTLTVCTHCAGIIHLVLVIHTYYFIIQPEPPFSGLPQLTRESIVTSISLQSLIIISMSLFFLDFCCSTTVSRPNCNQFFGMNRIKIIAGKSECTMHHSLSLTDVRFVVIQGVAQPRRLWLK